VCNGGTWKIPARPGEASSEARSARRSFPKEIIPDFFREILEKNPVILEKNPVLLSAMQSHDFINDLLTLPPAHPYGPENLIWSA
jgi:hypothetical protein